MENTRTKFKYYDASPNPDHFTKEQIERVIAALKEEPMERCEECGHTAETGACYSCRMD